MLEKVIVLLFFNEIFLKIIPKSILLGALLKFFFIICVYNLGCMNMNMDTDTDTGIGTTQ